MRSFNEFLAESSERRSPLAKRNPGRGLLKGFMKGFQHGFSRGYGENPFVDEKKPAFRSIIELQNQLDRFDHEMNLHELESALDMALENPEWTVDYRLDGLPFYAVIMHVAGNSVNTGWLRRSKLPWGSMIRKFAAVLKLFPQGSLLDGLKPWDGSKMHPNYPFLFEIVKLEKPSHAQAVDLFSAFIGSNIVLNEDPEDADDLAEVKRWGTVLGLSEEDVESICDKHPGLRSKPDES